MSVFCWQKRLLGLCALATAACGGSFETSGDAGTSGNAGASGNSGASGTGGSSGNAGSDGGLGSGGSGTGGSLGVGGNSGSGGTAGTCAQGVACAREGSSCTGGGCCSCLYECTNGRWQTSACPSCLPPSCPPEPPADGEACDACRHPLGTPCTYDLCPEAKLTAICDGTSFTLTAETCHTGPCCNADSECESGVCVSNVCKQMSPDGCWRDSQCEPYSFCSGAFVCPCGADCPSMDVIGTCVPDGAGCCRTDSDCSQNARCVAGVCKPKQEPGACWTNRDCPGGACVGADVCECAMSCLLPDTPGLCQ